MLIKSLLAAFGLSLALSLPGLACAAGFDCAKAASPVEKNICNDPGLSSQDEALSDAYKKALAEAPDQAPLRTRQRQWMTERNACADVACLRALYAKRLGELKVAPAPAAQAPAKPQSSAQASPQAKAAPVQNETPQAFKQQRKAWRDKLNWPDDCEEEYGFNPGAQSSSGVEADKLGEGKELVRVTCAVAAYQMRKRYYLYDEGAQSAVLLNFKTYERDAGKLLLGEDNELAGLETLDAAQKTLTVLSLGRGVGDCGSYVVYSLNGPKPAVLEARAQACSTGPAKPEVDPKKWPKVEKP